MHLRRKLKEPVREQACLKANLLKYLWVYFPAFSLFIEPVSVSNFIWYLYSLYLDIFI